MSRFSVQSCTRGPWKCCFRPITPFKKFQSCQIAQISASTRWISLKDPMNTSALQLAQVHSSLLFVGTYMCDCLTMYLSTFVHHLQSCQLPHVSMLILIQQQICSVMVGECLCSKPVRETLKICVLQLMFQLCVSFTKWATTMISMLPNSVIAVGKRPPQSRTEWESLAICCYQGKFDWSKGESGLEPMPLAGISSSYSIAPEFVSEIVAELEG